MATSAPPTQNKNVGVPSPENPNRDETNDSVSRLCKLLTETTTSTYRFSSAMAKNEFWLIKHRLRGRSLRWKQWLRFALYTVLRFVTLNNQTCFVDAHVFRPTYDLEFVWYSCYHMGQTCEIRCLICNRCCFKLLFLCLCCLLRLSLCYNVLTLHFFSTFEFFIFGSKFGIL